MVDRASRTACVGTRFCTRLPSISSVLCISRIRGLGSRRGAGRSMEAVGCAGARRALYRARRNRPKTGPDGCLRRTRKARRQYPIADHWELYGLPEPGPVNWHLFWRLAMKLSFSKGPLLAVLVVAALAAGTVLVAGYVDQTNQAEKVSADGKCSACPRAGTAECCKVTGVCAEDKACTACEAGAACTTCEEKAQTASCPVTAAQVAAQASCPVAAAQGAAQACCPAEGATQACCPATAAAATPQACCGTDGCCTEAK